MKITNENIMIVRYLRGLGLQQGEIADLLGMSRQAIAYQLNKKIRAILEVEGLPGLKQAGGVSPLVGYVSAPRHPPSEDDEPDHTCMDFVRASCYAQMEDLPKHQKIAVLLALLQEVELE